MVVVTFTIVPLVQALRVSMEEQRQRQQEEERRVAQESAEAAPMDTTPQPPTTTPPTPQPAAAQEGEDTHYNNTHSHPVVAEGLGFRDTLLSPHSGPRHVGFRDTLLSPHTLDLTFLLEQCVVVHSIAKHRSCH